MRKKSYMLWTCVEESIRRLVEKIAKAQGLTISEYIRQLVIQDLDRKGAFMLNSKEEIKEK